MTLLIIASCLIICNKLYIRVVINVFIYFSNDINNAKIHIRQNIQQLKDLKRYVETIFRNS